MTNAGDDTASKDTTQTLDESTTTTKNTDNNQPFWRHPIDSFYNFVDEGRLERLRRCRDLEQLLKDCKSGKQTLHHGQQLEDSPTGLRMVKYYEWRDFPDPSCHRETHAVWACRGMALGCGEPLLRLKECFQDAKGGRTAPLYEIPAAEYGSKSTTTSTGHNNTHSTDTLLCRSLQEEVGQCVAKGAKDLADRQNKAR